MKNTKAQLVSTHAHDNITLAQYSSVCTISNGYLGLKGVILEDRDCGKPTTIINGVYDVCDMFSTLPAFGDERVYLHPEHFATATLSPSVANLPNPLYIRIFVEDREISLQRGAISDFSQSFDVRTALHTYEYTYTDADKNITRIHVEQFAHITDIHRVFMRYTITPLNYSGKITIISGINGDVVSNVTGERQCDVINCAATNDSVLSLDAETHVRHIPVQFRTHTHVDCTQQKKSTRIEDKAIVDCIECTIEKETPLSIEKTIVLACGDDEKRGLACCPDEEIRAAIATGFDAALDSHTTTWNEIWDSCDIEIDGDEKAQLWLRFCLCHCIAAAPRYAPLPVPVKLLTGDYYQGNTFYDTDTYIIPFYSFTHADWAKKYLLWRIHGLDKAREIAEKLGYRGAKFAWQAGPNGEECLGHWWRFTHSNIHINADIVYAILQYVDITGDTDFLYQDAAPVLIESARFYADRAVFDESDKQFHLEGVSGPDEGHCTSRDNFYTNYLAQQTMNAAADMCEKMHTAAPEILAKHTSDLSLDIEKETKEWRQVADNLAFIYNKETKIFEQFDGFYSLEEIPEDFFATRRDRKEWFAPVRPYQAIHQPDVEMAMCLYREKFADDVVHANHAFYYPRTMNFSSMSFAINAITCADAGEPEAAYDNFIISAGSDIDATLTGRGDTAHGLHGTAMGGAWMAAVFGFAGVSFSKNTLHISPRLPKQWKALLFTITIKGIPLKIEITHTTVDITAKPAPMPKEFHINIACYNETFTLDSEHPTFTFKS